MTLQYFEVIYLFSWVCIQSLQIHWILFFTVSNVTLLIDSV